MIDDMSLNNGNLFLLIKYFFHFTLNETNLHETYSIFGILFLFGFRFFKIFIYFRFSCPGFLFIRFFNPYRILVLRDFDTYAILAFRDFNHLGI